MSNKMNEEYRPQVTGSGAQYIQATRAQEKAKQPQKKSGRDLRVSK